MKNIGLVLEGGGMRGLYTCGVLEFFLDQDIHFQYAVGVSAGASNTCTYIARQKGRGKRVNIDHLNNWRYMSVRSFVLTGSYFGMDFIFGDLPNRIDPFDFDTFYNSSGIFRWGAVNCITGKTEFFDKHQLNRTLDQIRASCSLPLLSPMVNIDGTPYLDGGVSDPIPYQKALDDGCEQLVVVLTQPKGYRKKPCSKRTKKIYQLRYKNFPRLVEALVERHERYNNALDEIDKLEKQGKAWVIRPSGLVKMGRFEKNPEVLSLLFDEGYKNAHSCKTWLKEIV